MEPFEETSCRQVRMGRAMVGVAGLPVIFTELHAEQYEPDDGVVPELLERARQHNYNPSFSEGVYAEALLREFKEFYWQQDYGEESASGYGTWRGHPREKTPWYPTINDGRCDGCGACVTAAKRCLVAPATGRCRSWSRSSAWWAAMLASASVTQALLRSPQKTCWTGSAGKPRACP
jgi:hypothetical protein